MLYKLTDDNDYDDDLYIYYYYYYYLEISHKSASKEMFA